jgi:hypothetical protein
LPLEAVFTQHTGAVIGIDHAPIRVGRNRAILPHRGEKPHG